MNQRTKINMDVNNLRPMQGFLNKINIKSGTEEAECVIEMIYEFIERVKKLDRRARKVLLELVIESSFDVSKMNNLTKNLEIECFKFMKKFNYDQYDLKLILEELIKNQMCYLEEGFNGLSIILTGMGEYGEFFYDLREYCDDINVDEEEILVNLQFHLLNSIKLE